MKIRQREEYKLFDFANPAILMELAHEDPRAIIERAFWIINKDKEVVPFVFNDLQNLFYEDQSLRDDILKPGQIGFSTMIIAILTVKFLLVPNAWCVIISHQEEATKRLFEKVQFFLNHLPEWLKPFYKPGKATDQGITNDAMGSKFYIGTAGARAFGRGDTIHYAHLSEISRWRSAEIATGIIRAVPLNDPHTWIVKETTANGVGNMHHKEYMRARQGKSEFKAHFFPFFLHKEYRVLGADLKGQYDEEEQDLLKLFPGQVNDEILAWRRQMVGNLVSEKGWTPEEMFKQEFPATMLEAFLFSGNPVFPVKKVVELQAAARAPIFIGDLEGSEPYENLIENKTGPLRLWDMPAADGQYLLSADVGQLSDPCTFRILNRRNHKTVATFWAQMEAFAFGKKCVQIGSYFNNAILAIEVNNMGQSTIDAAREADYPFIYQRKRLDKVSQEETNEYGWSTSRKTKELIVGYMQKLLREEDADIPDAETLEEMLTFVHKDNGSMEASGDNLDDRVMAALIGFYLLKLLPWVKPMEKIRAGNRKAQKFRQMRTRRVGNRGMRPR